MLLAIFSHENIFALCFPFSRRAFLWPSSLPIRLSSLAMALMSLRIWELLALAGPMLFIILMQTVFMALFAYFVTFRIMGKNFDAAIIAGGHCGFGMGATPTAVANMEALVSRFGPSPQAFLVVPMVGAFFIDITNALTIQLYLALPFVN